MITLIIISVLLVATIILAIVLDKDNKRLVKENKALEHQLTAISNEIVVLSDQKPRNGKRSVDNVLQLSDQLKNYIRTEKDRIYIKVLK